jgi:Iap family predicted aminopeptidase
MPQTLDRSVLEDELAVSLARAVAAANNSARREGVELKQSLVTAAEHTSAGETCWRISYGPRDYVRRRGGDLLIEVGLDDAKVRRVLRGQ